MANERTVIEETTTTTKRYIQEKEETSKPQLIGQDPVMGFLKGSVACLAVATLLIIAMQPRVNVTNNGGNNTIYLNK